MTALSRTERHLRAAEGYLELEMPEHALREIKSVPASDAPAATYHQLKGESFRQLKQYDEALNELGQALEEKSDNLSIIMGMAWCYKRVDQLSDAIRMMQLAYEVDPENPLTLYNMACYCSLDGDKTRMLEWLGRALRKQQSLRKLIPKETDFDAYRDDPDFQFLIGEKNRRESS